MKTVTEKYHAVLEGKMAKKEFLRQMRQQYPTLVTQFNGFDDTVKIFKNKGMLFEKTEVEVYEELNTPLDALERGIRYELEAAGVNIYKKLATKEEYEAAKAKAEKNLKKDINHYLIILAGESPSVDKNDKPREVKRGEQAVDTFNGLKKATLKEESSDFDSEFKKWEKDDYINPGNTKDQAKNRKDYLDKIGMPPHLKEKNSKNQKDDYINPGNTKDQAKNRKDYLDKIGMPPHLKEEPYDFDSEFKKWKKENDEFQEWLNTNYTKDLTVDGYKYYDDSGKGYDKKELKEKYRALKNIQETGADIYDQIANDQFGMDYDQLGPNEQDWVRDEIDNTEVEEDYSPYQTSYLDSQGRPRKDKGEEKDNIKESLKKLKEVFPKVPTELLKEFTSQHIKQLREDSADNVVESFVNFMEAKAKPDYLDVDGDGDKKETFQKALKDKEKNEALKEAIKKVIVKVLNEGTNKTLNEAATVNLAKLGTDYENWTGMKEAIIDLQNIVTNIESFYDSMRDKVQAVYNKLADVTNADGLKVGPLIAPAVESAFLKDLKDVKQFNAGLTLPKTRIISSRELQAMQGGEELEEEDKQTLFSA